MSKGTLTQQQQEALGLQAHRSVVANAGSGKTKVLVERFVKIISTTDTRVERIVAITFTEKAAAELRKKIASAIQTRLQQRPQPQEKTRLQHAYNQLASAHITTIHAFCAAILREYPIEANVDAGFTVLESIDQRRMQQESYDTAVELALRGELPDVPKEKLLNLVRMLGRKSVNQYIVHLLNKREFIEQFIKEHGVLEGDEDSILEKWDDLIKESILKSLESFSWNEILQRLSIAAKPDIAAQVFIVLQSWSKVFVSTEAFHLLNEIMSTLMTKEGTLRKISFNKDIDLKSFQSEEQILGEAYAACKPLLEAYCDPESRSANNMLLHSVRTLLRLYRSVIDLYTDKKFEQGKLDFDDLQLAMTRLLNDEEIQTKLSKKFSYIMVDEYQDTNRLQYEIVRKLVMNFAEGNLFIVGDPKQSIYGFRNADVNMFSSTTNDMIRAASEGRTTHRHTLFAESFRLLPDLVAFTNVVFSKTFNRNAPFDVAYENLVSARAANRRGRVDLMLIDTPVNKTTVNKENGEEETAEPSSVECDAIARRLCFLKQSGYNIIDQHDDTARQFRFSDAAILLRDRRKIQSLELALLQYGVPYTVSGGIGYFQTQELYDFLNYCSFLLNSYDDFALTGILRSSFFTVSDAEIFELSLADKSTSLWERVQFRAASDRSSLTLKRASNVIEHHLSIAGRVSIPMLLDRIMHDTGWQGVFSGSPFGHQRIANIHQLSGLAREFESRGLSNLYDFIQRLRVLVSEEDREGQAVVDLTEDVVHVMTIHASKGLEFPVVFVPFADSAFRPGSAPYFDPDCGVGFNVRNPNNLDEDIVPPFSLFLKKRSWQKAVAEEKRVFYVACTRARDALIISGNPNSRPRSGSYLEWVMNALNSNGDGLPTKSITVTTTINSAHDDHNDIKIQELPYELTVNLLFHREEILLNKFDNEITDVPKVKEIKIQPLQAQVQGEFYSATQIRTFLECPTKYYLKYFLGLPELNVIPYDIDDEEEANDRILGSLAGQLTHAVLQHLMKGEDEKTLNNRILKLVGTQTLLTDAVRQQLFDSILKNVTNLQRSKFGEEMFSAAESFTEYTLNCKFSENYCTGTIDRLFKDHQGLWNIVDYKTDNLTRTTLAARVEMYKPQLAFYAMLVNKYYHQPEVRSSLIFLQLPDHPVHIVFREEDIIAFEKVVQEIIQKIVSHDFHRTLSVCPTCTFMQNHECLISP